jgi:hypothetical protein
MMLGRDASLYIWNCQYAEITVKSSMACYLLMDTVVGSAFWDFGFIWQTNTLSYTL